MAGPVAIAWVPVGGDDVQMLGKTRDIDAWSTLKVPISVAVTTRAGGRIPTSLVGTMRRTITYSDNDGAVRLWRSLGGGAVSASKVQDIMEDHGDTTTTVRSSSFGRTSWALPDAARFAAQLPCHSADAPVLELMGQVVKEQRWGLGALGSAARFKGGWGPSDHGYLMRQLGVVTLADGQQVAVTIAHQPRNGHAAGAANLSKLATWFAGKLGTADGGRCG